MGSKNRVMILSATFLCLSLHFPSQTEAGAELVIRVCKHSQNYQSCVQINPDVPSTNFISA